ncbi:hypothetical protein [Methylomonas koyamae]|uniref:hypothetical protein n=1 Tax=Methylomonas koyamae TaxID=702114 RepID=UPI0028735519|nr:hypothetical protein [Methylomonas koyamae]WNB75348.1 hypothetical protein RI210_19030 [Methylomonas koyamae]
MERVKQGGGAKSAKDLGIAQAMPYSWQAKNSQTDQPFEEQKLQQAEIARLKRANARLKKGIAFLKKAAAYLCPMGTLPSNPGRLHGCKW